MLTDYYYFFLRVFALRNLIDDTKMPFNPNQPELIRLARRYAENTRRVVFWIGAGLSAPAGLPSWGELKRMLCRQATEIVNSMEGTEVDVLEERLAGVEKSVAYWDDFGDLKEIMGEASFNAAVREALTPKNLNIPPTYSLLWKLDIDGVINLNLDPFAKLALQSEKSQSEHLIFTGLEVGQYSHAINLGKPFIAHVHGVLDQTNSWVFTKSDLSRLLRRPAYKPFISNIFQSRTVVFLGISADDVAAGGFLSKLKEQGIESGEHYWITHRKDPETHRWAQTSGLQVIRYSADMNGPTSDHQTPLAGILKFIAEYEARDDLLPPVIHPATSSNSAPLSTVNPNDLLSYDIDEIRKIIATHVNDVLKTSNDVDSNSFRQFIKDFKKPIQLCWMVDEEPPDNIFFGYTIEGRIGGGVFSDVYKAYAPDGTHAAVKIIRKDSASSEAVLNSFRRGVKSIDILNKAKAPGVATLLSAYEMPTCIITEFVQGPRLSDVVQSGSYDPWGHGLPIMMNTAAHVRASHVSNEVLHRDIRPSNIIVPEFFTSTWDKPYDEKESRYHVIVLNYDMSWHRGAKGDTALARSTASGYQAPEQIEDINGISSRNARVDSYGLGMTMYYVFTEMEPPSGGSKSVDWEDRIWGCSISSTKLRWKSAGLRIKRLIYMSTVPNQHDRMDLLPICNELEEIRSALINPKSVTSASLWADEIMFRVIGREDYDWNQKTSTASIQPVAGRFIEVRGVDGKKTVCVRFSNAATGSTDRSAAAKKWPLRLKAAMDILKSGGWQISPSTRFSGVVINLEASCSIDALSAGFDTMLDSLNRAISEVRLD